MNKTADFPGKPQSKYVISKKLMCLIIFTATAPVAEGLLQDFAEATAAEATAAEVAAAEATAAGFCRGDCGRGTLAVTTNPARFAHTTLFRRYRLSHQLIPMAKSRNIKTLRVLA